MFSRYLFTCFSVKNINNYMKGSRAAGCQLLWLLPCSKKIVGLNHNWSSSAWILNLLSLHAWGLYRYSGFSQNPTTFWSACLYDLFFCQTCLFISSYDGPVQTCPRCVHCLLPYDWHPNHCNPQHTLACLRKYNFL